MKKTLLLLGIIVVALAFFYLYISAPQKVTISQTVQEITSLANVTGLDEPQINTDLKEVVIENKLTAGGEDALEESGQLKEKLVEQELPESTQTIKIDPRTQINVPFIVQAPFADWSERYQETCEEASILMVHNFFEGIAKLGEEEMKTQIDTLTDWGDNKFSGNLDTNIEDTALYLLEYFKYAPERIKIIKDPTIDDLKAILDKGYPIIVPAAGRELGNKYFTQPGPLYHMLVLTGYDHDQFITNDPGTKRGEGYRYKQEVLYNAIHDWTGDKDTILEGGKTVLVITL